MWDVIRTNACSKLEHEARRRRDVDLFFFFSLVSEKGLSVRVLFILYPTKYRGCIEKLLLMSYCMLALALKSGRRYQKVSVIIGLERRLDKR